jgi:hypothetical protein
VAGDCRRSWTAVESWNDDWSSAGLGRERPRIFVAWASHAMFNDQGGLTDAASQLPGPNEFRNADHPVHEYALLEVTEDNDLGKKFRDAAAHFGDGLLQNPVKVARDVCDHDWSQQSRDDNTAVQRAR